MQSMDGNTAYLQVAVHEAVAPALKAAGFRKKATLFRRVRGDLTDVVALQKSAYYSSEKIRFTANVGIFSSSAADLARDIGFWRRPERRAGPSVTDCQVRARVGGFSVPPTDQWWTVAGAEDGRRAGRECAELLVRAVLPRLDALHSAADLLESARGSSPLHPPHRLNEAELVAVARPEEVLDWVQHERRATPPTATAVLHGLDVLAAWASRVGPGVGSPGGEGF